MNEWLCGDTSYSSISDVTAPSPSTGHEHGILKLMELDDLEQLFTRQEIEVTIEEHSALLLSQIWQRKCTTVF